MDNDFLTPEDNISMDDAIVQSTTLTAEDDPRLDPILPSKLTQAQKMPNERIMTMDEAIQSYRLTQEAIQGYSKIARGDITTHFWGNVAKGAGDFLSETADMPDKINAAVIRAFNGHAWPNMSENEAIRLMDASTSYVANQQNLQGIIITAEGGADSIGRNLGMGAAQVIAYGVLGALTGGAAVGVLAGVQEAADLSQELAEVAMERGDGTLAGYNGAEDAVYAALHGVISGWIEQRLGVENLFTSSIKKRGITTFARSVLGSTIGEGAEEYLQEASKFFFANLAGKNERTFSEFQHDALTNAAYGAILGGTFGSLMYYPNVKRLQKSIRMQGYSEEETTAIANDMIDTTRESIVREVDDRAQIREHYGEQWEALKNKIVVALENAGWKETNPDINLDKYAEDNADNIVRPLFRFSNKFGIDTRDLIQLADIDVIDNAIYLRPGDLGTPDVIASRIKEKQDEVKRLTMLARTGAGNPERKNSLKTQIELLQKYYEKQTGDRFSAARRSRAAKARADAEILATTTPAVSETIANIDTAKMTSGQPTTQIRERMDGNPFVYVGNQQLPVEYKVVPMSEVIASHIGQDVNTNYTLKELQNRAQRGSRTDVSILQARAAKIQPENLAISYNTQNGAPIVNDRGEVIAGNGRYEVLRMTDERGRARYNKYLESLGLDLTGIENPVLVRVMHGLTPAEQIAVADASNVSATSAFDNASQAVQDAKLLADTNGVTDFLNKIPIESRQGLFLANDRVNKVALERRYNDALMMWLLNNDTQLYEDLYLMGGMTQKIQSALYQSIPGLMSLESQYPAVGLRADLAEALKKLPAVARSNDFAFTISQSTIEDGSTDLFNQNALLYALTFGKNTNTWEGTGADRLKVGLTLSEFFDTYTRAATTNQENIGKTDLFGQPMAVERTRGDILAETITIAFPREFEDGTAKSRDMRAVFLTRAQTEPGPTQFSQIDLRDTIQPTLFPADTSTASAVKNLPWERPVDVIQPIFFNRKPDKTDILAAKTQGYDSFLILDKTDTPTQLVLLDGTTVNLRKGAKIPTGAELYKAQPTQLLQTEEIQRPDYSDIIQSERYKEAQNISKKTLNVVHKYFPNAKGNMSINRNGDLSYYISGEFGTIRISDHISNYDTSNLSLLFSSKLSHIEEWVSEKYDEAKTRAETTRTKESQYKQDSALIPHEIIELWQRANLRGPDGFYSEMKNTFGNEYTSNFYNKLKDAGYKGFDVINFIKFVSKLDNQTPLFQGRRVNGFYDPELEVIVLGRNSNTGTLPHEMAHFWANTMFNLVKSGKYSNNPDFMEQAMGMFKMLGVGMSQQTLTHDQHEQFAYMTEAVIFGMARVPEGVELPITAFLNWVPAKYKAIEDIGYRNSEGRVINPILDKHAVEWFNAWYSNGALPAIDASPLAVENSNGQTGDRILPSSAEVMKVRATEMEAESNRLRTARDEQTQEAEAATPASERASIAGATAQIESEPDNIDRSAPPAAKKKSIVQHLIPGRGTNTREGMFAAAREYIAKDRAHAEEVAFGNPAEVMNDTGVDRAILIRALMEEYSRGDAEYAALYHNLAETVSLAGKTPGLSNDMNFQYYLKALGDITEGMEGRAAIKYAGTRNLNKARRTFNSDIDAFIQERANEILRAGPDTQLREAMINKMFAEAAVKFGGEDMSAQLNQEDLRRVRSLKSTDRAVFTEWAQREVRKMLKAAPDTDIINKVIELSETAEKARKLLDSDVVAEASAAAKKVRNWQMFVKDKEVPETWVSKIIGSWYTKAMLYNINTHLVNVTGNSFNYGIVKAAVAAQYKHGNKVAPAALTAERKRLHEIYDSSLINLAAMSNPTSPTLLKGEQYNPREGKSTIGKIADFSMDMLGKEDAIFRIRAYLDALGHIATADAAKTGQDPTALFNEYKKINQPKDSRAYEARQEALHISDLAVFQQNGVLSGCLKRMRDNLNFGQRAGLGTLLAPFVKTPANIVGQGARAIAAPLTAGYHAAKGQWTIQDTIDSGYFVLACILTAGLMSDYEPPYEPGKAYDPNKPYDSLRIRGTDMWIKLDTFAAASVPLRIIASIATGKGLGLAGAANEVPLIGDMADAYGEAARIEKDPYKQGVRFGANWAYNRVNTAVPAIIKYTLAAAHPADLRLDEIDVGLPKTGIGRKIGRQYGLAGGDTTTNDILRIFFNRLKIYAE